MWGFVRVRSKDPPALEIEAGIAPIRHARINERQLDLCSLFSELLKNFRAECLVFLLGD